MPINVVALINAAIADAEALLIDSRQRENKILQQRFEGILTAAHFIETELKHFAADDGMIYEVDRSKGSHARAPFAMVETGIYLLKKLHQLGTITLSANDHEQIERIERNITLIRKELDSFWSDGASDS